MDGTRIRKNYR